MRNLLDLVFKVAAMRKMQLMKCTCQKCRTETLLLETDVDQLIEEIETGRIHVQNVSPDMEETEVSWGE